MCVCERACARAPTGRGSREGRGGEAERHSQGPRRNSSPSLIRKPGKRGSNVRVARGSRPRGGGRGGGEGSAARAGSKSELGWAERNAQPPMQQRRRPQPTVALLPLARGRAARSRHRRCRDFSAGRVGTGIEPPPWPPQPWRRLAR